MKKQIYLITLCLLAAGSARAFIIVPNQKPIYLNTSFSFEERAADLVSQIGSGFVRGMMGDDPRYLKTVPCGKHFIANNTEFNRQTGSSDMDNRDIHEFYREEITGDKSLVLRLTKAGSNYSAYYSLDGQHFEKLGASDILLRDIKAGLIACDGIITQSMTSTFWFDSDTTKPDTSFDVSFDYFRIQNNSNR